MWYDMKWCADIGKRHKGCELCVVCVSLLFYFPLFSSSFLFSPFPSFLPSSMHPFLFFLLKFSGNSITLFRNPLRFWISFIGYFYPKSSDIDVRRSVSLDESAMFWEMLPSPLISLYLFLYLYLSLYVRSTEGWGSQCCYLLLPALPIVRSSTLTSTNDPFFQYISNASSL